MKKLNSLLFMALCAVLSFTSCNDEEGDVAFGITGLNVVTAEGASYAAAINQAALTITATVPMNTTVAALEECTLTASLTMNTTVTVNNEPIEGATFDLNNPIVLTAACDGETKDYVLTVVYSTTAENMAAGVLVSADIKAGGIPADAYAYSVARYDGKFYAFTSSFNAKDSIGSYDVYTSANGVRWEKAAENIGGMGAGPVVYNDKLYIIGGIRPFGEGADITGTGWSMSLNLKTLRTWSTDGTSWTDEGLSREEVPADPATDMFGLYVNRGMFGFMDVYPFAVNDKLYLEAGSMFGYGMFQAPRRQLWENTDADYIMVQAAQSSLKAYHTTYTLGDATYFLGGTNGYFGASTMTSGVYKTTDFATFELAAETTAIGNIAGATVVTNKAGDAAYLFGGCYYGEDGGMVMNSTIYKTTDGTTWEAVEGINPEYQGTFIPYVMVDDNNVAWVFGGFNTVGQYSAYSLTLDDIDASFAAWAFQLD